MGVEMPRFKSSYQEIRDKNEGLWGWKWWAQISIEILWEEVTRDKDRSQRIVRRKIKTIYGGNRRCNLHSSILNY